MTTTVSIDRQGLTEWYRRNRARSQALFDLIDPAAYYGRPISLRNPIVFYEGHLPAFSVIAFLRRGLGKPPVDARLEELFARGIDPETEETAAPRSGPSTVWPSRAEVQAFARACDEAVYAALANDALPVEGLYTALEHEAMHQETLLYMWHRLPYEQKRVPSSQEIRRPGENRSRSPELLNSCKEIPAGIATLGAARNEAVFGWDNEFERHSVHVPAFDVDALPVTNAQFLEFMNAGGYENRDLWSHEGWSWIQADRIQHPAFWLPVSDVGPRTSDFGPRTSDLGQWFWRGMFEPIPLPASWPVYVSHAEADAYARWKGRRLITEPEFHRAAYGTPSGSERTQPSENGAIGYFDFLGFDPVPVGSYPQGVSAWGVHDLVGNGWEWTSTIFGPFPGFRPMASYPEYSADFFDGQHYVMKGASPATAKELVRPSFRNWFRGNYPYVYAKFRTAK